MCKNTPLALNTKHEIMRKRHLTFREMQDFFKVLFAANHRGCLRDEWSISPFPPWYQKHREF